VVEVRSSVSAWRLVLQVTYGGLEACCEERDVSIFRTSTNLFIGI
jgi:hypothetical protein